ncbi:hypothetical protein FRC01_006527, partial [Tulasnella sp. 417]
GELQLWDIEGVGDFGGVCGSFNPLVGSVDGAVVTEVAGEPVALFISTTECRTYSFILDLPHQNQDHKDAYALFPHNTTLGFSGLKDKRNGWWAFARSQENTHQGFLSVPDANTPLVRLSAATQLAENQNVLDMRLRDDVIVVARNQSIDLYNMSDVLELLIAKQPGTPLPFLDEQKDDVEQNIPKDVLGDIDNNRNPNRSAKARVENTAVQNQFVHSQLLGVQSYRGFLRDALVENFPDMAPFLDETRIDLTKRTGDVVRMHSHFERPTNPF